MMNMGKFPCFGFTCSNIYDVLDIVSLNKHGKFPCFNSANVRQSCHNCRIHDTVSKNAGMALKYNMRFFGKFEQRNFPCS